MKTMKLYASAAMALASLAVVAAEPNAVFIGTDPNSVYPWDTAANWKGGYCPKSASDVVSLAGGGATKLMLTFNSQSVFSIDSIVDAPSDTMFRFVYGRSPSRVTVRQMSGYCSYWPFAFWNNQNWALNCAYSGFNFTGDAEEPTVLNSYYLGTLPYFGVPAAGGKARINRMMHNGMFVKEGPGELTVRGPVGPDSGAFAIGGSLVLDAEAETRDDAPAPGAFCHVDSSRNLHTFYDAESGRTYVTNWSDAAGNGFRAYNNNWMYDSSIAFGRPYLSSKTVNGRPLVDFGRYRLRAEAPGDESPSGALNWSVTAPNVREVFMAVEMTEDLGESSGVAVVGNSGESLFRQYSATNGLFTNPIMLRGDVRVDGAPFVAQDDRSDPFRVRVISCAMQEDIAANAFGRVGSHGRGGFLLGEALVYTNELTEAERRQTIAYLKKRWLDAAAYPVERSEWDLGDIAVSNATIGVEAGRTARVKRVQDTAAATGLATDGIVKTGAGTLVVDRVVPSNAPITVEGGKLRFTNEAGNVPDDALPAGALINFDAESSAFDYDEGSDTDVTSWHSLANPSVYVATNAMNDAVRTDCPKRVASATPTGLHAVDFLAGDISDAAANRNRPRYGFPKASVYNGFIVWKNQYDKYYRASHFCDSADLMTDRAKGQLLPFKSNDHMGPVAGMNWRVNGLAVNPLDQTFAAMHGDGATKDCEWVLISFSSPIPVDLNGMARSRGGVSGGGCLVAALVGYSRPLADHERRAAEAYLMKRWLGKEHPDKTAWSGALAFGEGVENAVDTDADISPSALSLSSDSFSKSGSGKLSLGNAVASLSSISVEGGELEGELVADFCADAFAHFDASKTNTMEMTDRGDGTYSVSKWYDVRMNGLYASADLTHCYASPRYSKAAATGLLANLGYVDFGPTSVAVSSHATNELSAAMTWSEPSMSVREVHLVYADADYAMDGDKVGNPVSYATSSQQSGFIRQNSKGICFDKYQNMLCNTALDGSTTAQTTPKPDGFSVVSLVVTNHVSDALLLGRIGTFCNERNLVFGGVKLAEVIVFENMQSEERRRAIDAKLLKKWRGIGEGATIGVSMPSVTVAPGAEANILLKGEDGVATFSRIDVVYDGTDSGALVVGGAVDVSSSATVSVSLASGVRKVRGGTRVKILEADSLLNADGVGSWTLTLPAGSRASAHLVVDGNAVYAEFEYRGAILIVR